MLEVLSCSRWGLLPGQVAGVIGKAKEQYGKVDSVASCVGNMLIKPAHLTSDEEFMECIKLNTFSSFNILKAAVNSTHTLSAGNTAQLKMVRVQAVCGEMPNMPSDCVHTCRRRP